MKIVLIKRRCVYCPKKHLMDDKGNSIPGYAGDDVRRVVCTDSFCNKWTFKKVMAKAEEGL